jgi:hypothetical protein
MEKQAESMEAALLLSLTDAQSDVRANARCVLTPSKFDYMHVHALTIFPPDFVLSSFVKDLRNVASAL